VGGGESARQKEEQVFCLDSECNSYWCKCGPLKEADYFLDSRSLTISLVSQTLTSIISCSSQRVSEQRALGQHPAGNVRAKGEDVSFSCPVLSLLSTQDMKEENSCKRSSAKKARYSTC